MSLPLRGSAGSARRVLLALLLVLPGRPAVQAGG
jgi:hypothetical protein